MGIQRKLTLSRVQLISQGEEDMSIQFEKEKFGMNKILKLVAANLVFSTIMFVLGFLVPTNLHAQDLPVIGFSIGTNGTINESDNVKTENVTATILFKVKGNGIKAYTEGGRPFLYNVEISQTGDFVGRSEYIQVRRFSKKYLDITSVGMHQLSFDIPYQPNGNSTLYDHFYVHIPDDRLDEIDGSVTATLLPGEGYKVDPENNTHTVRVRDRDLAPSYMVTKYDNTKVEGERLDFQFLGEGKPPGNVPLNINYLVTATGNYVDSEHLGTHSVTMPAGQESVWISIPTIDDGMVESHGSVSVRILHSSVKYRDVQNQPIKYGYYDLNYGRRCRETAGNGFWGGSDTTREQCNAYSLVATIGIRDNDKPEVFVVSKNSEVEEGESASFIVGLGGNSLAQNEAISVNLDVVQEGDFLSASIPTSIDIPAGKYGISMELGTTDDNVVESDGGVSVTILPGSDYYLPPDRGPYYNREVSAEVVVKDNDTPLILVAPSKTEVEEGNPAAFVFASETVAPMNDLSINISVEQDGNFLSNSEPSTYTLPSGQFQKTMNLTTTDDTTLESNGAITVTLLPGSNYEISDLENTAIVRVNDNDTPVILVVPSKTEVEEGNSVPFVFVSETTAPVDDISIQTQITLEGDFLASAPPVDFTLPSGSFQKVMNLATIDDEFDEGDGSVTVKILTGDGYFHHASEEQSVATVTVRDNDTTPVISISVDEESVNEGDTVQFTVTSSGYSNHDLDVALNFEVPAGIIEGNNPSSVIVPVGSVTKRFDIQTSENEAKGANFVTMMVSIQAGNNYQVAESPFNSVTVSIFDTQWPLVGILPSTRIPIVEGSSIDMVLSLRRQRGEDEDLDISLKITQTGIDGSWTVTETRRRGRLRHSFEITSRDDSEYVGIAQLTVEVLPGPGYRPRDGGPSVARVSVLDNDEPDPAQLYSISIQPAFGATEITEGNEAVFTVSSSFAPVLDLPVTISVTDGDADFLASNVPDSILIRGGNDSARLSVQTVKDTIPESDGSVTVEIMDGTYYTPNDLAKTASLTIKNNNDTPYLFIAPLTNRVEEGVNARFRLVATFGTLGVAMATDLPVNIRVTETGDFIFGNRTPTMWTYRKDSIGEQLLSIGTLDDNVEDIDIGTITVTILPGSNYRLHPIFPTTAMAEVTDNDDPPEITIADAAPVTEGTDDNATFVLTASRPASESREVRLSVTGAIDFISGIIPSSKVLPANSSTITLELPIQDDDLSEPDGTINVSILLPAVTGDYVPGLQTTASVSVANEDEAVISIADAADVTEGTDKNAVFTLTASNQSPTSETIGLRIAGAVNFLSVNLQQTVELPARASSVKFKLPIDDDDVDDLQSTDLFGETDGVITVRVVDPTEPIANASFSGVPSGLMLGRYTVGDSPEASVNVTDDDDPPLLSIADAEAVIEGRDSFAVFTITATRPSVGNLGIRFSFSGATSFVEPGYIQAGMNSSYTILHAHTTSTTLEVPIADDQNAEPDGTLTVRILPPLRTGILTVGSPSMASVSIMDDDRTAHVISLSTNTSTVNEGGTFQITVNAHPSPDVGESIEITTLLIDSNGFAGRLSAGTEASPLRINSRGRAIVTVTATDDEFYSNGGDLNVLITRGMDYRPTNIPARMRISVNVTDNESEPVVSLSVAVSTVAEGSNFDVTLVALPRPGGNLSLSITSLSIDPTGYAGTISAGTGLENALMIGSSGTAVTTVTATNDDVNSNGGTLKIRLANGAGYRAHSTENAIDITVTDDEDAPVVRLMTTATGVTEGSTFTVTLKVLPIPADNNSISITTLSLDATGFAGTISAGTSSLNGLMIGNTGTALVTVMANDDSVYSNGGTIKVKLGDGTGYTAHNTDNTINLSVTDNESEPVVSLTTMATGVTEGSSFNVMLSATPKPGGTLRLSVTSISIDVNGFAGSVSMGTGPTNALSIGSSGTALTTVTAANDSVYSNGGTIMVRLTNGVGYTAHNINNSIDLAVTDNESEPVVSLTTTATGVTEGSNFTITLMATPKPSGSVRLSVTTLTIDQTGFSGSISAGTGMMNALVIASSGMATAIVTATNDAVYSNGGTIKVRLTDGTGYTAHSTNNAIDLTVTDDEGEPVVSLTTAATGVIEGSSFIVTLTANPRPSRSLHLTITTLSIDQTGFAGTISAGTGTANSLTIRGSGTATAIVTATNDAIYSNGGMIKVRLADGNGYTAHTTTNAIDLAVVDNEAIPVVSMTTTVAGVDEGSNFTITLEASPKPGGGVNLSITTLSIDQSGYAATISSGTGPANTLTIGNSGIAMTTVMATNDAVFSSGGTIKIRLADGIGYKAHSTDNAIDMLVTDNEGTSVVSLATDVSEVTEGSSFTVTLTATPKPGGRLNLLVTTLSIDSTGFAGTISVGTSSMNALTIGSSGTATTLITATNDSVYSNGGTIKLRLADGTGYMAHATDNSIDLTVVDDESVPVVSMVASSTMVDEGSSFKLTLTAIPKPGGSVEISVTTLSIANTGFSGTISSGTGSENPLTIGSSGIATATVTAINDDVVTDGGTLTVNFASGTGYTADPLKNQINVSVTENDGVPIISLSTTATNVTEGGSFEIMLTANSDSTEESTIEITTLSIDPTGFAGTISTGTSSSNKLMMSGNGMAMATVTATNDTLYSNGGTLKVRIVGGIGYTPHELNRELNISVSDDESEPVVSLTTTATGVTEGSSFTVTLTAMPRPGGNVNLSVTTLSIDQSGFAGTISAGTGPMNTLTIGNTGIATTTVTATNDAVYSNGGTIKVRIANGTGYTVHGTKSAIDLAVSDDEGEPVVSLTTTATGVTEGSSFAVTLTATPKPGGNVSLSVTSLSLDASGFAGVIASGTGPTNTLEIGSTGIATTTVTATNDSEYSNGGTIKVRLADGTGYTSHGTDNAIDLAVTDNEGLPVVSLTTIATGVTEGSGFTVTLTATPKPGGNLNLSVTTILIDATGFAGSVSAGTSPSNALTIGNSGMTTALVTATNDTVYSNGGTIKVRLTDGTGYTAHSMNNAINLAVLDDEGEPVVKLETIATDVNEGSSFVVTLTTEPRLGGNLTLSVTTLSVDPTGFAGSVSVGTSPLNALTIGSNGTATAVVSATNDAVYSNGGTIKVRLADGTGYTAHRTDNAVDLPVLDNENEPVVSLTTSAQRVSEGSSFTVTLTAMPRPGGNVNLSVTTLSIDQSGFAGTISAGTGPMNTLTIGNTGIATTTVTATNDAVYSNGGTIKVRIANGTGYTVHGTKSAIDLAVSDDEGEPVVSLTTTATGVTEGSSFAVTLTATPKPGGNVSLSVTSLSLDASGFAGVIASGTGPTNTLEIGSTGIATTTVTATNDSEYSNGGTIKVRLADGTGYTSHGTDNAIDLAVTDNEGLPVVSLTTIATGVTEGSGFTVTLTATPKPGGNLNLSVTTILIDATGFAGSVSAGTSPSNALTIGNSGMTTALVTATNDTVYSNGGTIKVRLTDGTGYTAHSMNNAINLLVTDDEGLPVVKLSTSQSHVNEGETFGVTLTPTPSPGGEITLLITTLSLDSSGFSGSISSGTGRENALRIQGGRETMVMVTATDDLVYSSGGTLIVRLADGTGYTAHDSENVLRIPVIDNEEVPVVSISTTASSVDEGASFVVTLTASPKPGGNVYLFVTSLYLDPTGFAGEITAGTGIYNGLIIDSSGFATVIVRAEDDEAYSNGGRLQMRLVGGIGYNSHHTKNFVNIPVVDNEDVPVVSLTTAVSSVDEGSTFNIELTALPKPGGNVILSITSLSLDTAGFAGTIASGTGPDNALTIGNSGTAMVAVTAVDDDMYSNGGTLRVLLANGTNYTVHKTQGVVEIPVIDNDEVQVPIVSFRKNNSCDLLLHGGSMIDCQVYEDVGTMRIPLILTGYTAEKVSVSVSPGSETSLTNSVTGLPGELGRDFNISVEMIEFNAGLPRQELSVDIINNDSTDGTKVFTIRFHSPQNAGFSDDGTVEMIGARVTIMDDDIPTISVVASSKEVNEGEPVILSFSSNRPENVNDIAVRYVQEGENIPWPIPRNVDISGGRDHVVTIDTVNSPSIDNGRITATIVRRSGGGYEPDSRNGSVSITIKNTTVDDGSRYSIAGLAIGRILESAERSTLPRTQFQSTTALPMIEISAVEEIVPEGSPTRFELRSTRKIDSAIAINLDVSETGQFLGESHVEIAEFETGGLVSSFSISTVDDEIAEPDGRIVVRISEGQSYRIGIENSAEVTVSDESDRLNGLNRIMALNRDVLPILTTSHGAGLLDTLNNRVDSSLSSDGQSKFQLGGGASVPEMLMNGGQILNDENTDWFAVFDDTSFDLNLAPNQGVESGASVWGYGKIHRLDNKQVTSNRTLDGETFTGYLGIERKLKREFLVGLINTKGQADYNYNVDVDTSIRYKSEFTSLHPFIGYTTPDGNNVLNVTTGLGVNETRIYSNELGSYILRGEIFSTALRGKSQLISVKSEPNISNELIVTVEAWLASQISTSDKNQKLGDQIETGHYRVEFSGRHNRELDNGATFNPQLSIGVNMEEYDGRNSIWTDIGGTVKFNDPMGWDITGKSGIVLSPYSEIYRLGLTGSINYDHGMDRRGIQLELIPVLREKSSDFFYSIPTTTLLDDKFNYGLGPTGSKFEVSYGHDVELKTDELLLTPYGGVEFTGIGSIDRFVGSRFEFGEYFNVELEGLERTRREKGLNLEFVLHGSYNW